ncbi:unnamed protein product [Linum trigynum]|uniref:RNase H type-1 domain-containing protein n=2 Tax=Linum trigynum TaxID=586398 RepID=A0AAV2G2L7_9ROSI
MWFLWNERNNQQFNGKKLDEEEVAMRAQNWILEYRHEQQAAGRRREQGTRRKFWQPPGIGILKVNTDAGCLGEGGTGLGMVVRDWTGAFRYAAAKREAVKWCPAVAEGRAVLFALEKMNEQQMGPFEVEADCLTLVNTLRQQRVDLTELGAVCETILQAEGIEDCYTWKHTHREANAVAHTLAHVQIDLNHCNSWIGISPSFLLNDLYLDSSHLA